MEQYLSGAPAPLVRDPRAADVLYGLALPGAHPGNVHFMQLARMCIAEYQAGDYSTQPVIIAKIVASIKGGGGRFLQSDPQSGLWAVMDDARACVMTERALGAFDESSGPDVGGASGAVSAPAQLQADIQSYAPQVHPHGVPATAAVAASGEEERRRLLLQHMMANHQFGSAGQPGANALQHAPSFRTNNQATRTSTPSSSVYEEQIRSEQYRLQQAKVREAVAKLALKTLGIGQSQQQSLPRSQSLPGDEWGLAQPPPPNQSLLLGGNHSQMQKQPSSVGTHHSDHLAMKGAAVELGNRLCRPSMSQHPPLGADESVGTNRQSAGMRGLSVSAASVAPPVQSERQPLSGTVDNLSELKQGTLPAPASLPSHSAAMADDAFPEAQHLSDPPADNPPDNNIAEMTPSAPPKTTELLLKSTLKKGAIAESASLPSLSAVTGDSVLHESSAHLSEIHHFPEASDATAILVGKGNDRKGYLPQEDNNDQVMASKGFSNGIDSNTEKKSLGDANVGSTQETDLRRGSEGELESADVEKRIDSSEPDVPSHHEELAKLGEEPYMDRGYSDGGSSSGGFGMDEPGEGLLIAGAMVQVEEVEMYPLVLPEDKGLISDDLYLALEQMMPCNLTEADRVGCYKSQRTGFPGLACKHCTGRAGCGRYFPASEASLSQRTTSKTLINHVRNCQRTPMEIREQLEQMKRAKACPDYNKKGKKSSNDKPKHGGRKVFFRRLWCRIQRIPLQLLSEDRTKVPLAPAESAEAVAPPDQGAQSVSTTPLHSAPMLLSMPLAATGDADSLPPVMSYIRQNCIVLFEATTSEKGYGRQKGIEKGRVGVRCAFCGHLERNQRANHATSFPTSIAKICPSVVSSIQRKHFPVCTEMPRSVREDLARLKKTGSSPGEGDCKVNRLEYWIDSARDLGLIDTKDGIRFVSRGPKLVVEPNLTPGESTDAKKGSMERSEQPVPTKEQSQPSENGAKEPVAVTFSCPICKTDVHFSCAKTASESFGCHVKACGKRKQPSQTSQNKVTQTKNESSTQTGPSHGAEPGERRRSTRAKSRPPIPKQSTNEEDNVTTKAASGSVEKSRKKSIRSVEKPPARDTHQVLRGQHFSREEDLRLNEAFKALGPHWKKISDLYFNGTRTNEYLRKRVISKEYKQRMEEEDLSGTSERHSKVAPETPVQRKRKRRRDSRVKETSIETISQEEDDVTSTSKRDKIEAYPHAPMGHLWLDKALSTSNPQNNGATAVGDSLVGRRWAWDEGYFVDEQFDPQTRARERKLESSLLKGGCACEETWLSAPAGTSIGLEAEAKSDDGKSLSGRARRSERSTSAAIDIADELARGSLDPHTLIAPEEYEMGPECRFAEGGQSGKAQPFSVRVNPDSTFLADLHAHLCSSEIIGLLGGRYVKDEKCIYVQAAFPCKATDRLDSGSTDVEMDPIGQIYATEAIANQGLSVVGWYHSHPDFQPTPSVVDVANQASYQQLFQGDSDAESVPPFVGLIVGTYDGKNPSSHSVMRWFHVRSKPTSDTQRVNYPMNLRTTNRHFRKMTFDNKSTEENVRLSMTRHGNTIRRALESRKTTCTAPGACQSLESSSPMHAATTASGPSQPNIASVTHTDDKSCLKGDPSLSVVETGEHPVLLSDALFEQASESKKLSQFPSASPLYFTEEERAVLEIDDGTIPHDVFAGIIWFAVEREQQMLPKAGLDESMPSPSFPASSRSILELLLRQSLPSSTAVCQKLYHLIHCLEGEDQAESSAASGVSIDASDAAIYHNVDAMLTHYAPKVNKINPFCSWPGAGDKGKELNGTTSEPWADFYLKTILRMKPVETEEGPVVLKGGSRMKRGHKIASSLLKWARNMQLGSVTNGGNRRDLFSVENSRFDHEQTLCDEARAGDSSPARPNQYIYFVSEVMRLLAARWRECGTKANGRNSPQRRGRPPKRLSSSGIRPMDEGTSGWACVTCNTTNPSERKRCNSCMGWKGGSRESQ